MTIRLKIGACIALAAFALGACGGGGGSYGGGGGGGGGGVAIPPKPEDRFGVGFGAIFRAQANTDPAEPAANFIIPLDLTTDPLPID